MKAAALKIAYIGQMQYQHLRDKFMGIMRFASANPDIRLQQFDYTQIPPKQANALLMKMDLSGLIFGDGSAFATFRPYLTKRHPFTAVIDPLSFDFGQQPIPDVTVELDHSGLSTAIGDFFLRRGYANFAYLGYNDNRWIPLDRIKERSALREKAFSHHVENAGFACSRFNISGRLDDPERQRLRDWLIALPKPCAIMAFWDRLARDAADVAIGAGLNIPDQIAIMGTDNDPMVCTTATPTLSTLPLDFPSAGMTALRELVAVIRRGKRGRRHPNFTYGALPIIDRSSTTDLKGSGRIVSAALAYIREHALGTMTATEVATHLHISPRILQLRFAETLGRSIRDEITALRLSEAMRLADSTSLSSSEIATRCGWTPHHFVNYFKLRTGLSLRDYRKKAREQLTQ